ncbi:ABC transporter ATP-binding protein [bacterium]|nr:ABC transporter ATP-binding protein [bacterium]
MTDYVLEVNNLKTTFKTDGGVVTAVDGVSFKLERGKTLGLVGESGCGKSVTSLSVMRLLPKPAGDIAGGEVLLDIEGEKVDISKLHPSKLHSIRGKRIAMIFQEPMTALNPVHRVGRQLAETFELHFPSMSKDEIKRECIEILDRVGIASPEQRLNEYPHQLSGGMRQRVMIAIALACKPDILIADEPTTALDVTVQAQILELMKKLQQEIGMSIIFITHDLGVVAEVCDDIVVMYAGRVAEKASALELFKNPQHPYTRGLLSSIPNLRGKRKTKLQTIEGMVPSLANMPVGCRFENRCTVSSEKCSKQPDETRLSDNHIVACFKAEAKKAEAR